MARRKFCRTRRKLAIQHNPDSMKFDEQDHSIATKPKVPYLPDEILSQIFENLEPDESDEHETYNLKRRDLVAIAQCSRRLCNIATPILWAFLRVNMLHMTKSKQFLRSVLSNPQCSRCVKEIRFAFLNKDLPYPRLRLNKQENYELLMQCLAAVRSINVDSGIRDQMAEAITRRFTRPLQRTASIEALCVERMRYIDAELVMILAALPTLEIAEINVEMTLLESEQELQKWETLDIFVRCLKEDFEAVRPDAGPLHIMCTSSRKDHAMNIGDYWLSEPKLILSLQGYDIRPETFDTGQLERLFPARGFEVYKLTAPSINHELLASIPLKSHIVKWIEIDFEQCNETLTTEAQYSDLGLLTELQRCKIDGWMPPPEGWPRWQYPTMSTRRLTTILLPAAIFLGTGTQTSDLPDDFLATLLPRALKEIVLYYTPPRDNIAPYVVERQLLRVMQDAQSYSVLRKVGVNCSGGEAEIYQQHGKEREKAGWKLTVKGCSHWKGHQDRHDLCYERIAPVE